MSEAFEGEVLARLERIEGQVTAINGRVRKMEEWRAYIDGVRDGAGGLWHIALATLGTLAGVAGVGVAIVALTR